MALTNEERAKTRYHLGYLNTNVGSSLALGIPSASQLMFILESTMNTLREDAEFLVRRAIAELDCIEDQLSQSRNNYSTKRVDELHFDTSEEYRLTDQYMYWSNTLADIFGVPINPFSKRHRMISNDVVLMEPN